MKKNNEWMSIMLAVVMTFSMVWLSIFILSYIKPFAEQTKSIENSVEAYYVAYSWVEKALFEPWSINTWAGNISSYSKLDKVVTTSIIPENWKWSSTFDKDFNILKVGQPIELTFNKPSWKSITLNSKLEIKVPDVKWNGSKNLDDPGFLGNVLNWTISWTDKITWDKVTLQANPTWWLITYTKINSWKISISSLSWINSTNWSSENFWPFYNSLKDWEEVKIKFTVINRNLTSSSKKIPYLEAKLDFSWDNLAVKDRFINIDSDGRVYWYQKNIKLRVPSETTSEAFDFTIFQ